MPSSYSDLLRLEKQATSENQGTWGTKLNNSVIELVEDAIAGANAIVTTGGDTTLTSNNGSSDQARMMINRLTGTLTSNANIIIPNISKMYVFRNGCDTDGGTYAVTVKTADGTGVTLTETEMTIVICDGSDNVYKLKISATDLLNVLGLTQDTSPDRNSDYVVTHDASAVAAKRVLLRDVGGMALLGAGPLSAASEVEFDLSSLTAYNVFKLYVEGVVGAISDIELQVSTDGGSNYKSGASDYQWVTHEAFVEDFSEVDEDDADSSIEMLLDVTADSGVGFQLETTIINPFNANTRTLVRWEGASVKDSSGLFRATRGCGQYKTAAAVNAFRVFAPSTTITGKYSIIGIL